ncbi:MAG: DUF305 domain-containing protein [Pyrinomonadaceae bacterium]|nr:DUF305 domain-containing protein [Pyrinomonadaceae bacterium]
MKFYSLMLIVLSLFIASCSGTSEVAKNDGHANMDHSNMNHSNMSNMDHSNMDHSGMDHSKMQNSPGAADAPIELQFIDTMTVHHQEAVDMAKMAETRAERAEVKKLAANIIADQDREITQMKRWRDEWFKDAKPAINMDLGGATGEHMDLKGLGELTGDKFDKEFVRQMIVHHKHALQMSKAVLESKDAKSVRAEIRQLAESINKTQSVEIADMEKWLESWNK